MKHLRQTASRASILTISILCGFAMHAEAKPIFINENGPRIKHPDYVGGNKYDPKVRILIDLVAGGRQIRFQALHIPLYCEGEKEFRVSFRVRREPFPSGFFSIDRYFYSSGGTFTNDEEDYYFVHGARRGDRQIRGRLTYIHNELPASHPPYDTGPDCSTGPWQWKARPIGASPP